MSLSLFFSRSVVWLLLKTARVTRYRSDSSFRLLRLLHRTGLLLYPHVNALAHHISLARSLARTIRTRIHSRPLGQRQHDDCLRICRRALLSAVSDYSYCVDQGDDDDQDDDNFVSTTPQKEGRKKNNHAHPSTSKKGPSLSLSLSLSFDPIHITHQPHCHSTAMNVRISQPPAFAVIRTAQSARGEEEEEEELLIMKELNRDTHTHNRQHTFSPSLSNWTTIAFICSAAAAAVPSPPSSGGGA